MPFQAMVKFNNGLRYPVLGLGPLQAMPDDDESAEQTDIYEIVKTAIDVGYRHFDCAAECDDEKLVGKAIAEKIKRGVIKRKDVYITSKIWNGKHNPKDVEIELKKILQNLGLKYLDLFLIHWSFRTLDDLDGNGQILDSDVSYINIWKVMERCVKSGLTKSIGVSNFNVMQIKDILEIATIKPVVNQVENNPNSIQDELKEICKSNGILLTVYGALTWSSKSFDSQELNLLEGPLIKQVANIHKKSTTQILIKFQIQKGFIVVPESSNAKKLKENFNIWNFELNKEEMEALEYLNNDLRFIYFVTIIETIIILFYLIHLYYKYIHIHVFMYLYF